MKKFIFMIITLPLIYTENSVAYDGYIGSDILVMNVKASSEYANPLALKLNAGVKINENDSLELFYGIGLTEDEVYNKTSTDPFGNSRVTKQTIKFKSLKGILFKTSAKFSDILGFFVRLGYAQIEADSVVEETYLSNTSEKTFVAKDSGFAYELGLLADVPQSTGTFTISLSAFPSIANDGIGNKLESNSINIGFYKTF